MGDELIGKVLANGFVIERARVPARSATGGCHSMGYIARAPDGRQAFAKILDTTVDQNADDPVADLKARVDAYYYERNVVIKTRERRMSGVVRAIDFGEINLAPTKDNPAYYVLFELADGDLREQVELARRFDLAYRLRVLHNTAKGLAQLHFLRIAHQDLKPSNIVTFSRADVTQGEHQDCRLWPCP